jgi:predicted ArsR family transcriptional regulator
MKCPHCGQDISLGRRSLTPAQHNVMLTLRMLTTDAGVRPTMQEMAIKLGVSKTTIYGHVQELINKGYLAYPGEGKHHKRALVIVE